MAPAALEVFHLKKSTPPPPSLRGVRRRAAATCHWERCFAPEAPKKKKKQAALLRPVKLREQLAGSSRPDRSRLRVTTPAFDLIAAQLSLKRTHAPRRGRRDLPENKYLLALIHSKVISARFPAVVGVTSQNSHTHNHTVN